MKAKKVEQDFDAGRSVTSALDLDRARRPLQEQSRVNVDFPTRIIERLDREASRSINVKASAASKRHRSRRLRKKLRIGEFQEFGCEIEVVFATNALSLADALDNWITHVESQRWQFGGGGDEQEDRFGGFLCARPGSSLTEDERSDLGSWLQSQTWVKTFFVGALQDAWSD